MPKKFIEPLDARGLDWLFWCLQTEAEITRRDLEIKLKLRPGFISTVQAGGLRDAEISSERLRQNIKDEFAEIWHNRHAAFEICLQRRTTDIQRPNTRTDIRWVMWCVLADENVNRDQAEEQLGLSPTLLNAVLYRRSDAVEAFIQKTNLLKLFEEKYPLSWKYREARLNRHLTKGVIVAALPPELKDLNSLPEPTDKNGPGWIIWRIFKEENTTLITASKETMTAPRILAAIIYKPFVSQYHIQQTQLPRKLASCYPATWQNNRTEFEARLTSPDNSARRRLPARTSRYSGAGL